MLTNREREYIQNLPKKIAEQPVQIFPWHQRSLEIARLVIENIKSVEPDLEVFLNGSTPLKIAGQKDIDLTSTDAVSRFQTHRMKLKKLFGEPSKFNDNSIVWHFIQDGYAVSFYIVDPDKSDQLQRQIHMDNLLRAHPALLAKYEQLKISLNGLAYQTYLKKKYAFLNSIRSLALFDVLYTMNEEQAQKMQKKRITPK